MDNLPRFAGLTLDRPRLMGVLNVTPDSFSDGGRFFDPSLAIARGRAMASEGADIVDVGGESTRPGATELPVEEEIRRVVPVIEALAADGLLVSIDTRHAAVMRAALKAGAGILNDITALTGDPESLAVAADSDAALVLMHMQGEPATMQHRPNYRSAAVQVRDYLVQRAESCITAGIAPARISLDPGIGFGKSLAHNLEILARLDLYRTLSHPILLGVSRKSFISALCPGASPSARLPGSLAAALAGLRQGVQILRVHDVAETAQAVAVWRAIEMNGMV